MEKRILVIALVIASFAALCFSCSYHAYDNPDDFPVLLSADGRTVIITCYSGSKWRDIKVPPLINKKPVTVIGDNAFADAEIADITIPNGIKKIGAWAFSGNYIVDFKIPDTVTEIDAGAFMCNKLDSITIPRSVKEIGYRAFCENPLKSITIGKNVKLNELSGYDTDLEAEWVYSAFEMGLNVEFDEFYRQNGSKAGTYVLEDGSWRILSLSGRK